MTWYGSGRQVNHEDSGLLRVDYHISERMSAFGRYNTDHYSLVTPGNLTGSAITRLETPNIVLGLQNTITSNLMNDARFGSIARHTRKVRVIRFHSQVW
jgi:hypothetical protein